MQEPKKTVSTLICFIGVPAFRSMYTNARSAELLAASSLISAGFGTTSLSATPWPGLVPHVTKGASESAGRSTCTSKCASASLFNVFQYATAASQSAPFGA